MRAVVEAVGSQPLVVQGRDLGRVLGELDHVVDHHSLCSVIGACRVVFPQRLDQSIVQGDPTQKLCVRDNSVMALVGQRDHGGDHLVLPALERQVGRHQGAEGRRTRDKAPAGSACARRRYPAALGRAPARAAHTRRG